MKLSVDDFDAFHDAVHGRPPFPWQSRLLRQIVEKQEWPRLIDLPTGTGKTTCIDIALFALALDAGQSSGRWCPRRIAMVVDRRVVVDQVAERGRLLLRALLDENAPRAVRETAARLCSLSQADEPLAVFTLRGGMPKDDGWARTPDQPLILASTVDQLGSRLLIQGYGVSPRMKPVHAGLLGNDLLLLLDEVHLSQPFAETLDALDSLRRRFIAASSLPSRFHHVFLSATSHSAGTAPFRLTEAETSNESALGPRLHAPKRARVREEPDRATLERACIEEAQSLITKHGVVAVVVNRVMSAMRIARELRKAVGEEADVALLTGRMRPLDRDDVLRSLRPRIMTGRSRVDSDRKLIVIGTQCVEAGADFDFDALVTEAASFDALRQRFGRVDRTGLYKKAEGVIVRERSSKPDPIYGESIGKTIIWLKERLEKKTVDLGVLACPLPSEGELPEMLAPKARAPVLLPAYLDLWMQTSPPPAAVPDVSLWLHGPQSGPADVQVVWRADLTDTHLHVRQAGDGGTARERAASVVGAIRPSSLEAISLPFATALRWLRGADVGDDLVDVEGVSSEKEDGAQRGGLALRWAGDDSEVVSADSLLPGDTIVVPAARGGIRDGCFDPDSLDAVEDLAERAALSARGQPVLRLHPSVLKQLNLSLPVDDMSEVRSRLVAIAEETVPTDWRKLWLERLSKSRHTIVVDAGESSWTVMQGRHVDPSTLRRLLQVDETVEDGVEQTTDEDDSPHIGRSVPLSEHCRHVERLARSYALALGLPEMLVNDLALAGWLHDIGKADRRFQILLRGGSEIEFYKDDTPWAKSGMPAGAKAAHRLAVKNSGYPNGSRHEMQSVAMVETHAEDVRSLAHDLDLLLHLIASHHGHGRPFAPEVVDQLPVGVVLRHVRADGSRLDFAQTMSDHQLHKLESPLADRFWSLVGRFGWHGLCWLEAILRLADHRASEMEQRGEDGA